MTASVQGNIQKKKHVHPNSNYDFKTKITRQGELTDPGFGLHDYVPDRSSAKVASVGYKLATMALKMKTVTIRNRK